MNNGKYVGEFKNRLPNGYGEFFYDNGDYYRGNYINGLKNGYGKFV